MTLESTALLPEYFNGQRSDVANLVPENCNRILDVGCGFGGLGRTLLSRGSRQVYGVELNPAAESRLSGVYTDYWMGDVETVDIPADVELFDCIIFSDVLEHLRDPWVTLRRYCQMLQPDGYVVASIPNVRNIGLLYNLIIRGQWRYEDSGLLDRTHLRFFVKKSIAELFDGAGLRIERWEMNRDDHTGLRKALATVAKLCISDIDVCQYLVVARKQ